MRREILHNFLNVNAAYLRVTTQLLCTPKQRDDIHTRVIDEEVVILDRQQNLIHQLNSTATYVWDRCDGSISLQEIAIQFATVFDVPQKIAIDDLTTVIQQFFDLHLLVYSSE